MSWRGSAGDPAGTLRAQEPPLPAMARELQLQINRSASTARSARDWSLWWAGARRMPAGTPALLKKLCAAIIGFEMHCASFHSIAAELRDEGVTNFCGILRGNRHYRRSRAADKHAGKAIMAKLEAIRDAWNQRAAIRLMNAVAKNFGSEAAVQAENRCQQCDTLEILHDILP